MSATIKEVAALADVPKFMKEMEASSTTGECHNALAWLCLQIKRAGISDYNIHLCKGVFARYDHSWLQVEDAETGEYTVIDMTINQFGVCEVPYVGPMSPGYEIHSEVSLCAPELIEFIDTLGS